MADPTAQTPGKARRSNLFPVSLWFGRSARHGATSEQVKINLFRTKYSFLQCICLRYNKKCTISSALLLRLLQLGYLPFSSVSSDGNAKLNSIIGWFNVFLLFMACTDRVQSYTIHFTNSRFVPLYSAYILYPGEHCVTSKFHILQLFCPLILTMSFVLSKLNGNECALKLFCIQFS